MWAGGKKIGVKSNASEKFSFRPLFLLHICIAVATDDIPYRLLYLALSVSSYRHFVGVVRPKTMMSF